VLSKSGCCLHALRTGVLKRTSRGVTSAQPRVTRYIGGRCGPGEGAVGCACGCACGCGRAELCRCPRQQHLHPLLPALHSHPIQQRYRCVRTVHQRPQLPLTPSLPVEQLNNLPVTAMPSHRACTQLVGPMPPVVSFRGSPNLVSVVR
jgi:hypothetical protein